MKMTTEKKLLIFKILAFVFAFFVAFMPSTVSRSKEVNSRVIVEILGIDGGENVSITAQYVMPTESQGATSKDTVTVDGDTLTEAVEALNTALGRRAELGHCSMVIVGKDVNAEVLGTLMTATDVTADVYLSAAEDKAQKLVGDLTDFMKKTGATDADFIAYGAQKAHVATNTLLGFLSDLNSASESAYLPIVEMLKSEESEGSGGGSEGSGGSESGSDSGGSGGSGESDGGSGGEQKSKDQSGMNVERLALYNRNGRTGILECCASRGVAWVSAPIEKGVVTADVEFDGKTVKNVSAKLIKKSVSVDVDAKNGRADVKIKAHIEPHGDKFNVLDSNNSEKVNTAIKRGFAKKIESEVEEAYRLAFDMNCDPMFIGRQFYRYEPEYFNTAYDRQNISVSFTVEIILK